MPDDLENVESAEQDQELPGEVDEALKAFMEEDDDHTDDEPGEQKEIDDEKPEKDDDTETLDKDDQEKKTDKKVEKEPGKDTEELEEKETFEYPDQLKERLEETSKGGLEEKPPPAAEPPEEPDPEKKLPDKKTDTPPASAAPIDFENFDSLDDLLPDKEIKIGDQTINLKEYKKDYPDDFAAIMAVGSMVANKIVEQSLKSGQFVKADMVGQLHDKIQDMEFWDQITLVHSDAKKINKDPDFFDWLDEQDEPLQRLARAMETPEDGILILDFYKKSKGKKKAEAHDKKAKDKKKQTDDLHKGTMRNKKTVTQSDSVDMDDAEAAFNEDD